MAVVLAATLAGCAESTFLLAQDSKLPTWFELPPGSSRQDVSVRMDYYVLPSGREVQFKMFDSRGHQLAEKRGKLAGLEPIRLGLSAYPVYEIITINGISDVIEHRKMEPVFRVSDEPAARKLLRPSNEMAK